MPVSDSEFHRIRRLLDEARAALWRIELGHPATTAETTRVYAYSDVSPDAMADAQIIAAAWRLNPSGHVEVSQ
jgi:hypothetical protein